MMTSTHMNGVNEDDYLTIIYLWGEGYGEEEYSYIKEYGLDNITPVKINCIEITDHNAVDWIKYNAAKIDASQLPCFIVADVQLGVTRMIPLERKKEVYALVMAYYL